MSQTYDPILAVVQPLRLRVGSPLRGPSIGTALVLERVAGEPIVVWPSQRVPGARIRHFRRIHQVDVANRGLELEVRVPSSDPAFPFSVTLRFSCRITDPVSIVENNIRDMTAALTPSLAAIVRETAARFDVMHPRAAEAEIARRLTTAHPAPAVELTQFSAGVEMVDTEEIVTDRRRNRVGEQSRTAMRPIANGSREELAAHMMSLHDGDPMPMLKFEANQADAATNAKLAALNILMGKGDDIEEFNSSEISKRVLKEFYGDDDMVPKRRGGVRERIGRSRESLEGGSVVEGNVPDGEGKADPPPKSNGSGPSREKDKDSGKSKPRQSDDDR
ncbi:hypothetical protein [Amycolatopsis sp. cmx-11-12]|uniref:hypothetical protein n=1 Tax=Amycolatopsis sp. cmx-11-12 TaxID=2785795 RepID=UPI0039174307